MNRLKKALIIKGEDGRTKFNICFFALGIATIILVIVFLSISFNRLNFWINGTKTDATIAQKEINNNESIDYLIRYTLDSKTYDIEYNSDLNFAEKGQIISILFMDGSPSKIISEEEMNEYWDIIIVFGILLVFAMIFIFGLYNPDFIDDHCHGDVYYGD